MGLSSSHPAVKKLLLWASNPPPSNKPNALQQALSNTASAKKNPGPAARIAGTTNRTEQEFLDWMASEWDTVLFERICIPLNLQENCTYTPDVLCLSHDKPARFYEVKGSFWRDDARVKLNLAARLCSPAEMWQAVKAKGTWTLKEVQGESLLGSKKLRGKNSLLLKHTLLNENTGKRAHLTLPTEETIFREGKIEFLFRPAQVSLSAARHRRQHPYKTQTAMGKDFFSKDPETVIKAWQESLPPTVILRWIATLDTLNA